MWPDGISSAGFSEGCGRVRGYGIYPWGCVIFAIGFLQEGVVLDVVVQSYPTGRGRCGEYLKGCGLGVGLGEYLTGRGRCGEYLKGCGRCGEYLKGCGHGVGRGPGEYCNYPMSDRRNEAIPATVEL